MNSRLHDPARLTALNDTGLLDSASENPFDRVTRLVRRLLTVPVGLVSLVDNKRQFFKSAQGLPEPWATQRETPLSHSFCQHVVNSGEALVVEDSRSHPIVSTNRAVSELGVVAYLGVPLTTPDGHVLGSLCAIDGATRHWSDDDIKTMRDLADIVMREIALRREVVHREAAEAQQRLLIGELHHRVKNTLSVVQSLISLSLRSADNMDDFRDSIIARIGSLAKTHTLLVEGEATAASLRTMIEGEVEAHSGGHRIALDGPDVTLPSQVAVAVGMALHELITNAVKYGALSVPAGHVDLRWAVKPGDGGDHLLMEWLENGGPVVHKPERRGFGSALLERVLSPELNGEVAVDYRPEGVRARIEARLGSPASR
jgi:two-component sensor histidine kinase